MINDVTGNLVKLQLLCWFSPSTDRHQMSTIDTDTGQPTGLRWRPGHCPSSNPGWTAWSSGWCRERRALDASCAVTPEASGEWWKVRRASCYSCRRARILFLYIHWGDPSTNPERSLTSRGRNQHFFPSRHSGENSWLKGLGVDTNQTGSLGGYVNQPR